MPSAILVLGFLFGHFQPREAANTDPFQAQFAAQADWAFVHPAWV